MIRVPGVRSRTVDSIVSSVDILPTILSVLGLPAVRRDGVSIVPLLTGATTSVRSEAFTVRTPLFETFFTTEHGDRFDALRKEDRTEHFHDTAIRTDEWRLVHRMSIDALSRYSWWSYLTGETTTANEFSLYHISEDPLEKYDVLDKYPSIASELKARLLAWEKETEDTHATLKQFTGSHQDYF
jgi:arylsulfatase A-like enzyme